MNKKIVNWLIFIALSIIWGSSFELMKLGLFENHDFSKPVLTAFQVASIRIISSGLILLPIAIKRFKHIPTNKIVTIFFSGLLGSLIPAYLFCIAETKIDGSLAGSLNSLTPVFVIVIGVLFFKAKISTNKIAGIIVSFIGCVLLYLSHTNNFNNNNLLFLSFIIVATILYGLNANMVGKSLTSIPSLDIAAIALSLNAIPALVVLYFVKGKNGVGFFSDDVFAAPMLKAIGFTVVLGVLGTALASIIFYKLMKSAGIVFASMVTYAIPLVAVLWGVKNGESIGWEQVLCLAIILSGVYIANRVQRDDA
jgi:drug/metabolite transporter (DMT)-like permease